MTMLLEVPPVYYVLALMIGAGLFLWTDRWEVFLLAVYCCLVFTLTVLSRSPENSAHYNFHLFWSWRQWEQQAGQILANVAVFVPIGVLAGMLWGWKSVLFAAGFSVLIELVQLISCRGFFEFDDMAGNTLGAAIGWALTAAFAKLKDRLARRD